MSRLRHNICSTKQPFPASFFKSQQRLLFLRPFLAVGTMLFHPVSSDCNIMRITFHPLLSAFFAFRSQAASFPSACGVHCLRRQYKYGWSRYCCDRECRRAWQCPFRYRKIYGRTDAADYAETLFRNSPLLQGRDFSFPAKCSYGSSACRFV